MSLSTTARAALIERLQQAQREQNKVTIHLRGVRFDGTVYRIENDLLQLRISDGKLAHIVLDTIDAITTE